MLRRLRHLVAVATMTAAIGSAVVVFCLPWAYQLFEHEPVPDQVMWHDARPVVGWCLFVAVLLWKANRGSPIFRPPQRSAQPAPPPAASLGLRHRPEPHPLAPPGWEEERLSGRYDSWS
jgi:hypothetical protein